MHGTLAQTAKTIVPALVTVENNPAQVLIDKELRDRLFDEIGADIKAAPGDMDVKKNRDARRALAARITRSKKPIDDARKAMKAKIDATAKDCIGRLEALQTDARAPLDKWEDEEKTWKEYQVVAYGWTSDLVLGRLECAKETPCTPSLKDEKEKAIAALDTAHKRLLQEEADAEELARLREKEADAARMKAEEDRQAAELAAALDAKAAARAPATEFASVRQGVQDAQTAKGAEPKFEPTPSAAVPIVSSADAALIAKLTEIREDIMRAAAAGGVEISVQAARSIVRAIVARKVRHIPELKL